MKHDPFRVHLKKVGLTLRGLRKLSPPCDCAVSPGNPRSMAIMPPSLTRFRSTAGALAALGFVLGSGCVSSPGPSPEDERVAQERVQAARTFTTNITEKSQRVSIPELDQLTYGYADRYYMVIGSAVDALKRNNPDPVQRQAAHQIKLQGVLAMNDIVSSDDPYARTLDLVVSVTLESIVLIDENKAEQVF